MSRCTYHVAVYLLIYNEKNELLFMQRANTGWGNGAYSLVAGHVEANESILAAAQREAFEEVGLELKQEDFEVQCIMQRYDPDGRHYIDYYLRVRSWQGGLSNKEPHKCSDLAFHNPLNPPANTLANVQAALAAVSKNERCVSLGF